MDVYDIAASLSDDLTAVVNCTYWINLYPATSPSNAVIYGYIYDESEKLIYKLASNGTSPWKNGKLEVITNADYPNSKLVVMSMPYLDLKMLGVMKGRYEVTIESATLKTRRTMFGGSFSLYLGAG